VSENGVDVHPVVEGSEEDQYIERMELQPIDPQTNGPQLFYGLRYHTHIVKPGEVETFHDQVGYWLWEPAARTVTMTLAIPRGQVLLASGPAEAGASDFELTAERGSTVYGICSNPFLEASFRTESYRIHVTATSTARGPTRRKALRFGTDESSATSTATRSAWAPTPIRWRTRRVLHP
jgi:hypothetical protein